MKRDHAAAAASGQESDKQCSSVALFHIICSLVHTIHLDHMLVVYTGSLQQQLLLL